MVKRAGSNDLSGLLGDFRLLLILFVAFRLLLLFVYQPLFVDNVERGMTAQGDFPYFYSLASLSDHGLYPFRNWWTEFPPLWYGVIEAAYQWQGANANYSTWSILVGMVLIAFDTGNLILIRRIGAGLHGESTGMALAWIYALLLAPLVFLYWNFESIVAFFLLLSLAWLLEKREIRSALAMTLGALTKFTPALLLGAVFRFRPPRAALRYLAVALGLFVLAYLPLLVQNAAMTLPSLTAQFGKASYQTVWALLDGNMQTGIFGSIESHLDPAQAGTLTGNPARIPGWLRLGAAALIGLLVYARTQRFDDKGLVAFVSITLLIFFLQAQGWSPQWLAQIIPLLLLSFPNRTTVLIVVMLSALTFIEYPFLFIRTGDTDGKITGALVVPFVVLVLARTAILIGACIALYRRLRQTPVN